MSGSNQLNTSVSLFEDTRQTFSVSQLLSGAGYTPTGAVHIDSVLVRNPGGGFSSAPTNLLQITNDGNGIVISADHPDWTNWFGNFSALTLVIEGVNTSFTVDVAIAVLPVNDPPDGTDKTIALTDASGYVLREDDFGFRDPVEGHAFKSVVISSLPTGGVLVLNGVLVRAGDEVSVADLRAGVLVYQPASGSSGSFSFGFQVRDNGGAAQPGDVDLDPVPNHITFTLPVLNTVQGRVWIDGDADGVRGSGEQGASGVSVTLVRAGNDGVFGTADDVRQSTTSGSGGTYTFSGVPDGIYRVEFGGKDGYMFTAQAAGANTSLDSDANSTGVTASFMLGGGGSKTLDAGLVLCDTNNAAIGDRVWNDANGNGVQDAGEAGLAGVSVTLRGAGADGQLNTGDDVLRSTTSAADGRYGFTALSAGTYQVEFGGKTGYGFTEANVGNDATDSDADAGGKSQVITLAVGQTDTTVDAGYKVLDPRNAAIGDRVWNDTDRDGVQDAGEAGISGVTVTLKGAGADGVLGNADDTTTTTTTNASGNYAFTGLAAGRYQVEFGGKTGFEFTTANNGDDTLDSDADVTGRAAPITLAIGQVNNTVDAGLRQIETRNASIGDRVWNDANGNGLQDAGEAGLSGISVTLKGAGSDGQFGTADDTSTTTVTNASGVYGFTGLAAGQYKLEFGSKPNYMFTAQDAGGNDTLDSDADSAGRTQAITLGIGEQNTSLDAGLQLCDTNNAVVGDRVWADANGNGVQDAGESGLAGVSITLRGAGADGQLNTGDDVLRSTTSAADGRYGFTALSAGTYQVEFGGKTGFGFTTANVGNDATDSDADAGGKSQVITLAVGQTDTTVDAGYKVLDPRNAAIGDRVWNDADRDGVQDAGEAGISGVTVTLKGAGADGVLGTADDTTTTTTTNTSGNYAFASLAAGQYQVHFGGKTGFEFTTANVGDDAADSDADAAGRTGTITLAIGQVNNTVDAGLRQIDTRTASVGDRVWVDANGNGLQDAGEGGKAGVTVNLLSYNDNVWISQVTDANGGYRFSNLAAGQYAVSVGAVAGFNFTTANVGSNDAIDSDVSSVGVMDNFYLGVGQQDLTRDAGLRQIDTKTASISDWVWNDANRDGWQSSSESGISGVTVTLRGAGADGVLNTADDTTTTTVTNSIGNYAFNGLAAGQYQVHFGGKAGFQFTTPNNAGGDDFADSDADATGKTHVITLAIGQNDHSVDAGMFLTDTRNASIGDRVWNDLDRDGVQDAGEAGISGLMVNLKGAGADGVLGTADDTVASTMTNTSGNYAFTGLAAGQYRVVFGVKEGFEYTTANVGDDTTDSDADASGRTGTITLAIGEVNNTVDAGLRQIDNKTASVGDRVWVDANGNGLQDAGEVGKAGVTVNLLSYNDNVWISQVTGADGGYKFSNLAAGQYAISVGAVAGFTFTTGNVGSDDAIDSDVSSVGVSDSFFLGVGQQDLTRDAGLRQTDTKNAAIGDRVWNDTDRDGVQDTGEAGISGVTVTLKGAGADGVLGTADDTTATTTTNSSGNYSFGGLAAGQYQVHFGGKTGVEFTTANVGADATDSDADTSGKSHVVTLGIGEVNNTVDAGLRQTDTRNASIGDRVWNDADRDGVQDAGEVGISGVSVTLMGAGANGIAGDADDVALRSTTTNTNGNYSFTGLAAGQYQVVFGGKSGFSFTTANVGADATDSDANVNTGKSHVVTLGIGQTDNTVDAGMKADICASINGVSSINEGSSASYNVSLTSAVQVDTVFKITVLDGTAGFTSNSKAPTQTIAAGGGYENSGTGQFYANQYWTENGIRTATGPSDMNWDFSVRQNSATLTTRDIYVTVKAGQTTSGTFAVHAWKETVFVDRTWDGSGYDTNSYREASLENFSMRLSTTSANVAVCDPTKTVSIKDASNYNLYSPILLDLDGNGVQTTALADAGGAFDLLGNGQAVKSGWASSGDGFLAIDANGNGKVDGISELFGGGLGQGFAKLATYDSNGDGAVDANDANFGQLLVWQDANSNHATDAGELRTLAEAGIASLQLDNVFQNVEQNGNILGETSVATRTDGSTLEMIDVYFEYAALPAMEDLLAADNGLLDSAFGGAPVAQAAATAACGFDAAAEAQRAIAEAMKHAETSFAMAA